MQSLKSTAFAVSLLAISFGLYCVSSTDPQPMPETALVDPVVISDDFAVSQDSPASQLSATSESPNSFSFTPPPQAAASEFGSSSKPKLPDLPTLSGPGLSAPKTQFASAPSPKDSGMEPLELPSFSSPKPKAPNALEQPSEVRPSSTLELPEFSVRQPVSAEPVARDEGLIDALKSSEFKAVASPTSQNSSGFTSAKNQSSTFDLKPPAPSAELDGSFTSQASATSAGGTFRGVKTADGVASNINAFDSAKIPSATSVSNLWNHVDQLVESDNYLQALEELSQYYVSDKVTGPQRQRLLAYLDALAGKVIYSAEHHVAGRPYQVKQGDTLESLSAQLNVPAEVIYNINRDQFVGTEVTPGMELKIVQGPFHAEVDLTSKQLTLFIGKLYAGRFPVTVGISGDPGVGNYKVVKKDPRGYTWRDGSGNDYPPESPKNAYGPFWIGLSGSLCIHAVEDGTPNGHLGCIGLSQNDAKDIFSILSKASQIRIVK